MRIPQPLGSRGSLKWIQRAVATRPDLLQPAALPPIRWISPLAADDHAEYRDAGFLERIGQPHLAPALGAFWPGHGPQWDALGLAGGTPVLVEAKAHVAEFMTPASQAGPESLARIRAALAMVQTDLGAAPGRDWSQLFYQYANRLAHLWFLHRHGVPAHLLLMGFLNDHDMGGPAAHETWEAAHHLADHVLGLPRRHALHGHVHLLTPDVAGLIATD